MSDVGKLRCEVSHRGSLVVLRIEDGEAGEGTGVEMSVYSARSLSEALARMADLVEREIDGAPPPPFERTPVHG